MKKLHTDSRGLAHIQLVIVAVVAVAVIGLVAWRVMGSKKSSDTSAHTSTAVANKEVEDACNKIYNDKDFCKFASTFSLVKGPYKATFTTTTKDGKPGAGKTTEELDAKGNSHIVSSAGDGSPASEIISIDGVTYIKNEDNSWTKYPKSDTTPAPSNPANEDIKFDLKAEEAKPEAQRAVYKKLGKEKCGNATCFKYQFIDPSDKETKESLVWFGDKDYMMHKFSSTGTDGTTNVGEFEFTAVTISVPSPVKDAPAAPTQADIQKQIDAANAAAANDNPDQ